MTNNFELFFEHLKTTSAKTIADSLREITLGKFLAKNSDLDKWQQAYQSLPEIKTDNIDLDVSAIEISTANALDSKTRETLHKNLMAFHPWKKGPYNIFDIFIDCEWRSDWKWDRLKDVIAPLENKTILDVGCGNGYHCLRMLGQNAKAVIGIDPFMLFVMQFQAINKYIKTNATSVLPLKIEDLPDCSNCFDAIFSMGVLYHRKDPREHIQKLKSMLAPKGQLILETIIIDNGQELLVPEKRYAKMRNVWNIPSTKLLKSWLKQTGFKNVELIDTTPTTFGEQRKTPWMTFESLEDFLDKDNPHLTIEGHPAPIRAIMVAS